MVDGLRPRAGVPAGVAQQTAALMTRGARRVIAAHMARPLERNAYALALNAVVTAVLGLVYWLFAARYYTPRAVGEGSALVSAMVFLATCSNLNLTGAMTHFLPRAARATAALVSGAYAAGASLAVVLSITFVLVAPELSSKLEFFRDSWLVSTAFCVAVVMWVIFALQDGVLTGLRRADWVPVENGSFAVAKLVLLVPLATALPAFGIFVSWMAPLVLILVVVNVALFRRLLPQHAAQTAGQPMPVRARRVVRFVGGDYLGSLFLQGSTTLLPVLVVARLGAEANAHFYVAFLLVSAVDVMALNVGASLTVEGSREERNLPGLMGRTVRLGALLLLPAVATLIVAAPLLLSLFGESYAQSAESTLRLLALGLLAKGATILYVSACRARGAVSSIVAVEASTFAVVISLSLLLVGPLGLAGVGLAWLAGQTAVALVVLPKLRRLLRGGSALRPTATAGAGTAGG